LPKALANDKVSVVFVSQTPYNYINSDFNLSFELNNAVQGASYEITLDLFTALSSRSAYDASLNTTLNSPVSKIGPLSLSNLTANAGIYSLDVALINSYNSNPQAPSFYFACQYTCSGIYPVRLNLYNSSGVLLSDFVSHIVLLNQKAYEHKLNVANIISLGYNMSFSSLNLNSPISNADLNSIEQLTSVLKSASGISYDLMLNPWIMQKIYNSDDKTAKEIISNIKAISTDSKVEFLESPFSPIDPGSLISSGLTSEISEEITRGSNILGSLFHPANFASVWVSQIPMTNAAVSYLSSLGYKDFVGAPLVYRAVYLSKTATQPFLLENAPNGIMALAYDQALSQRLNEGPGVINSYNLTGELSQIFFDDPNSYDQRSVELLLNAENLNALTLSNYLSQLTNNPVLNPSDLSTVFRNTPVGVLYNPKYRSLTNIQAPRINKNQILNAEKFVSAISSMTGPQSAQELSDDVLTGISIQLNTYQKNAYLSAPAHYFNNLASSISMVAERDLTLTSNSATIPVTLSSRQSNNNLKVKIVLESNALDFKHNNFKIVVLNKAQTTTYFSVTARGTGSFPVDVVIESPANSLVLLRSKIIVNSNQFSLLGIILSIAAILLLLYWWISVIYKKWRGKKQRRLRRLGQVTKNG
jgi:hypothetical protein